MRACLFVRDTNGYVRKRTALQYRSGTTTRVEAVAGQMGPAGVRGRAEAAAVT